ncbi:MAG: dihydrolipoamide succinyltransferase [Bdellovibrionales bacterium GWB1_55_8]|nr:MAG: dihydrolipoamide succinyltransferase [Bdellovibrionales bacterium GWB1_55_8]
MKHEVKAPSVGESITEVSILKWARKDGEAIQVGDLLLEIETDKATVEVVAESAGALKILKQAGERATVGEVIAQIDDSVKGAARAVEAAPTSAAPVAPAQAKPTMSGVQAGPAARKMAAEKGIDLSQVAGTGKDGRATKGDLLSQAARVRPVPGERRVPMSMLRQRIAERLVQAQHTAAILTTFNEADMGAVMALRSEHKDAFKAKHGVSLGFMSFFTRACVEALKLFPEVNASLDGSDILYHDFHDIGIAVGTDRGLVVPVVRGAGEMGFVEIEKKVYELAIKARDGKLSIPDLSGGTFTITNGGVYGSLLSTPILNPPQSAILGMHKIQERPVAINGKVEIRPMMYLALSYDHRLIDGKGAVSFLVAVKDFIEHPEKLGLKY